MVLNGLFWEIPGLVLGENVGGVGVPPQLASQPQRVLRPQRASPRRAWPPQPASLPQVQQRPPPQQASQPPPQALRPRAWPPPPSSPRRASPQLAWPPLQASLPQVQHPQRALPPHRRRPVVSKLKCSDAPKRGVVAFTKNKGYLLVALLLLDLLHVFAGFASTVLCLWVEGVFVCLLGYLKTWLY